MLLVHYTFSHSTGHSTGHSVVRPAWVFMWQIALLLRQTSSLIESDLCGFDWTAAGGILGGERISLMKYLDK